MLFVTRDPAWRSDSTGDLAGRWWRAAAALKSGFGLVLGGTVLSASTDVEPNRALGEHELLVELVAELERAAFSFLVPNTWVPVCDLWVWLCPWGLITLQWRLCPLLRHR